MQTSTSKPFSEQTRRYQLIKFESRSPGTVKSQYNTPPMPSKSVLYSLCTEYATSSDWKRHMEDRKQVPYFRSVSHLIHPLSVLSLSFICIIMRRLLVNRSVFVLSRNGLLHGLQAKHNNTHIMFRIIATNTVPVTTGRVLQDPATLRVVDGVEEVRTLPHPSIRASSVFNTHTHTCMHPHIHTNTHTHTHTHTHTVLLYFSTTSTTVYSYPIGARRSQKRETTTRREKRRERKNTHTHVVERIRHARQKLECHNRLQ